VILKPATGAITNPISDTKVWPVEHRDEMLARYAEAAEVMHTGHVMIQEIIPGGGEHQLSYAATCCKGDPIAFLTARRLRQIPVDFGRASTFVETFDIPEIIEPSQRIIADLELEGLVEVEFKRDPRSNELKLLDVNVRAWGWHAIGAAAGVDFPYLAYRLATGLPVERVQGRAGVRWVRLTTDVPTSVKEIARGRMKIRPYLRSLRPPLEGPIAAKDDPKPALMELPVLAKRMLMKPKMLRRLVGRKV
jgi:D-aspartate ligase